jgi:hypothetical protein
VILGHASNCRRMRNNLAHSLARPTPVAESPSLLVVSGVRADKCHLILVLTFHNRFNLPEFAEASLKKYSESHDTLYSKNRPKSSNASTQSVCPPA